MSLLSQQLDMRSLFVLSSDFAKMAASSGGGGGGSGGGGGGGGGGGAGLRVGPAAGSNLYRLRGFICYYGRHYICFMYSTARATWLIFDDRRVGDVGDLAAVSRKCVDCRYQPTVVFYEQLGDGEVAAAVQQPAVAAVQQAAAAAASAAAASAAAAPPLALPAPQFAAAAPPALPPLMSYPALPPPAR